MEKLLGEGAISERDASRSFSCTQWSQWQILDSILPTGGFAHSFGLEAAVQTRLVSSPTDLEAHIIHVLDNTASLLLPFVYSSLKSPDIETWQRLDLLLDATLTNQVSSKASISQGSALFRIAASVFTEIPSLKMIRDASLGSKELRFHHAPIFGLVCGLLGMDSETSQRAYLFVTLRDVVSAATRLNLVGPMGASVMQHRIAAVAETVLEKWKDRDAGEACQTSPLLDVVQGCHGYLFSRLFCS
ncbi:Urease accessory protein F [Hirschfeldia incana]|nr:Urease accessory protein F [Hirschfeldia incana]